MQAVGAVALPDHGTVPLDEHDFVHDARDDGDRRSIARDQDDGASPVERSTS